MDDIQIIIYIIFVLFAIISRALKKKKEPQKKPARPASQNQSKPAPQKQLTFEELLKEFTEEQSGTKRSEPEYAEPESYEQEFDVNDDEEIKRIYEESVRASQKYEESRNRHDDKHSGKFKHFEHYSEEDVAEEESEYAKLLQDEDSAKNAIILSEIINRKY
ncbi:hypothetical protein [Fulvivirga lutea]|uniref:Uncharacterized protein n=1 Tax=Fulvivirga lutea TaxID=2810512 RepID=A0A974WEI9_9BACT|nr:hypothetical protein [Fulvivirga lutea]QSE96898.1 hypothetical protein JR347_15050 [Fulvivirga lutea]